MKSESDKAFDRADVDRVLLGKGYIAALVGRGGGKTAGGRARFLRRLLTTPGANCFYIAKTRDHAERLMWRPLKEIFRKIGFVEDVDVIYNETKLRVLLPKTGARLQLFGADKPGYIRRHPGGFDEYIPASQIVELSGTMDTDPKTIAELREWLKDRT